MEFKFRAVDDRLPIFPSSSSSVSYFTEQALRAGLGTTDPKANPEKMRNPGDVREAIQREREKERIREEIIVAEIDRRRVLEVEVRRELMMEREMAIRRLMRNPSDVREAIQRELEKDRIREEIIVAEIAQRRVLEAEVRRELIMEREMTMRRLMAEGLSFDSRLPPLHPFNGLAFPCHGSGFDMFPMSPLREAMMLDNKTPLEVNKDKFIILAKPNPNLSGAKQKAATPLAGSTSEIQPFGLKKRPKEEWSCALCQVSAANEGGLNQHLQGKKHKNKETGLRAQRMGKIASSTPLLKETTKPSQLTETTDIGSSGLEARIEGESLQQNKSGAGSDHKIQMTENLKNKNEQVPLQKKRMAEDSKKTNGTAIELGAEKTTEHKKQKEFKFWCEMCQIGAYSQAVMETHKGGKRHRAQLQNLDKRDGVVVTTIAKASSDDTRKAVDTELVAKEANQKTTETVVADAEKSGPSPIQIK